MSHISYAFNHSDIEATAYALTVLPRLGLAESEAQAEINYQLCCSAAKKLINHATDITPDEFRTIIAAPRLPNSSFLVISKSMQKHAANARVISLRSTNYYPPLKSNYCRNKIN